MKAAAVGKWGGRAHVCDVHACIMQPCLVPGNNLKKLNRILIVLRGFIHIIPVFAERNKTSRLTAAASLRDLSTPALGMQQNINFFFFNFEEKQLGFFWEGF